MGNLFQRLFSSDSNSREAGKRSRHKVNLNDSKKSQSSAVHSQAGKAEDVVQSDLPPAELDQSGNQSPFRRDFLPAHQPLVSLEKDRPRRSNIRRSSRMNTSMGKGDNVVRPGKRMLSTVPSYVEPDYNDEPPNVMSNRTDPTLPVSHSSQSGANWNHDDDAETNNKVHSETEKSTNNDKVDEMSPNERVKVAKSRISQMFIKREQQKHNNVSVESDASHVNTASSNDNNGYVLTTDYVRVYENIDNYGHYNVTDNRQHADENEHNKKVSNSAEALHVDDSGDDEHKVDDNHDTLESDQPDESSKPEVVPRRKPNKMFGNPMLIDELKKRQSTLYQVTERDGH